MFKHQSGQAFYLKFKKIWVSFTHFKLWVAEARHKFNHLKLWFKDYKVVYYICSYILLHNAHYYFLSNSKYLHSYSHIEMGICHILKKGRSRTVMHTVMPDMLQVVHGLLWYYKARPCAQWPYCQCWRMVTHNNWHSGDSYQSFSR